MGDQPVIKRIWTGHRNLMIVVPAIAVVAIIAGSLLLVNVAGGTAQASPTPSPTPTASPTVAPSDTPIPTPSPSPTPTAYSGSTPLPTGWAYAALDGVATTAALAGRLPMAIMVDDNKVARPQSGISSASIVYQAPADGGEDRYMFVFQEGTASAIGPVRSARPYYVYWADEYKALLGHFGGDSQTRKKVIPANAKYIYNMDALSGGGCAYHRVSTRSSPHNAYTSSGALITCLAARKYPTTYQNLPTRSFRPDSDPAVRATAQTISIAYRTGLDGYQFQPGTDSYLRLINGQPEIDPANNMRVYARNVIVMYQTLTTDKSEPNHNRPVVHNVGSGKALIFQEGRQIVGTWKKTSNTALTRFYDSSGKEIPLLRGEIFIQSIPTTYKVTVS
jgi:hypothetical protein